LNSVDIDLYHMINLVLLTLRIYLYYTFVKNNSRSDMQITRGKRTMLCAR